MFDLRIRRGRAFAALAIAGALSATAAVGAEGTADLKLLDITMTQAITFNNTSMVANNVTFVRAPVFPTGYGGPVSGIDAILRVYVDGVEAPWSPVRSMNGPITVETPNQFNLNDYVNFMFIAPEGADVDLVVIANPYQQVAESTTLNNIKSIDDVTFECRDVVECVYVPVNYLPGGGEPSASLIEPGIGDGFARAIYPAHDWNYHKSPLPTLTWTADINNSNSSLLNTLRDIRISTLPGNGYPVPDMVYGWLPGNPFSGNGQANGVPGDAAFGNSDPIRHQRTMAHELGHLFGRGHNGDTIDTLGIDVEHHLRDTQNLSRLHGANKFDIMVAGQLTQSAFVASETYEVVIDDNRLNCPGAAAFAAPIPVYRVSGVIDHQLGTFDFDPVMFVERGHPDEGRDDGDLAIIGFDAAGAAITRTNFRSGTARKHCVSEAKHGVVLDRRSPLHVLIPTAVDGVEVDAIRIIELATGRVIAAQVRSEHAPTIEFTGTAPLDARAGIGVRAMSEGDALNERIRLQWNGADADGDALTYNLMYSPDLGASWMPVALNLTGTSHEFNASDLPHSNGADGLLRVIASDGLNHSMATSPGLALSAPNDPEVFLVTPNDGDDFSELAPIVLHAAAWDKEDLMLEDDQISWTSNLDGLVATGVLTTASLSAGTHTLTVIGADTEGGTGSASIVINVTPRTPTTPDLTLDGDVGPADLAQMLQAWGPCGDFCAADLNLDGDVGPPDLATLLDSWGPVGP